MIDDLFQNATPEDVARLIAGGENQQVEFKENVSSIIDLAKIASAFGNAQGGVLIVGIREPNVVVGTNVQQLGHLVAHLGNRIRPLPEVRMHAVDYQGRQLGVVVFKPVHNEVAISDAGAFIRRNDSIRVMDANEIRARLPAEEVAVTNQHLAEGIEALSNSLDTMREELRFAQSPLGQWKTLLVGFALGIVASVIASFVYAFLTRK